MCRTWIEFGLLLPTSIRSNDNSNQGSLGPNELVQVEVALLFSDNIYSSSAGQLHQLLLRDSCSCCSCSSCVAGELATTTCLASSLPRGAINIRGGSQQVLVVAARQGRHSHRLQTHMTFIFLLLLKWRSHSLLVYVADTGCGCAAC